MEPLFLSSLWKKFLFKNKKNQNKNTSAAFSPQEEYKVLIYFLGIFLAFDTISEKNGPLNP